MRHWLSLAALLSVCIAGCVDAEHLLAIDLRTDYSPRAEFDGVVVLLDGVEVRATAADPAADYVGGIRLLELPGTPAGSRQLTVRLTLDGSAVDERPMLVDLREDLVLTALLSRSCLGVVCAEACQAGVCVSEECTPETSEACPVETECSTPSDCEVRASCSAAQCDSGTCLYAELPAACGAGEYCNPDTGCLSLMPPACSACVDESFGVGGVASIDFGGLPEPWTHDGALVARDGSIYLIGRAGTPANSDFGIARLDSDGQLDPTFGVSGIASFDVNLDDRPHMVVEAANGDLIVCGASSDLGVVARLDPSGTLVPTFGTAGIVIVDTAPNRDIANGCSEMDDGTIVAIGQANYGGTRSFDLRTASFLADGSVNPSFGTGGSVTSDPGVGDEFGSGQRDSSNRVLGFGSTYQGSTTSHDCLIVRYAADGTPDASFGTGGTVIFDVGMVSNRCSSIREAPSGMLIGAGILQLSDGSSDALAYRFDAAGNPDPTFGSDGAVQLDFGCDDDFRAAVALADGRIIATGRGCPSGGTQEGVVAFIGSDGALLDTIVLPVPGIGRAASVHLDDRGRIIVYGSSTVSSTTSILITRILP